MAIVSFWSNGTGETGKSSSIAALGTYLGVNHNYKTLIIDTKFNDYFYHDCYWREDKTIKRISSSNAKTDIGHGIGGLSKAILSNKTSPEIVTNYTKIVFNDGRLEILMDTEIQREEYDTYKTIFKEIARIANRYYDLVLVDIDSALDNNIKDSILEASNLIVACLPQKLRDINEFIELREQKEVLKTKPILPLLGKYDKESKYNTKNVARYIRDKRGVYAVPYNTLFMEACNEAQVAEFFIKFRKINEKDKNAIFISNIRELSEEIITRLKELQMRM